MSNTMNTISPVSQCISVCKKYKLIEDVQDILLSGLAPSKSQWSNKCQGVIMDYEFSRWRMYLRMYSKLSDFRVVYTKIDVSVWWVIARYNICLKKNCSLLMRLISGTSQLRVDSDVNVPRDQRICLQCDDQKVEDLFHMVIDCTRYIDIRKYDQLSNSYRQ